MNRPVKTFTRGNIVVDIWQNQAIVNGESTYLPNITIQRFYHIRDMKKPKYTTNFRDRDIPNIIKALQECFNDNSWQIAGK